MRFFSLLGLSVAISGAAASPVPGKGGSDTSAGCMRNELFQYMAQDKHRSRACDYCREHATETKIVDVTQTPTVTITKPCTSTDPASTITSTVTATRKHTYFGKITETQVVTKPVVLTSLEIDTVTLDVLVTDDIITSTITDSPTFTTTDATALVTEINSVPFTTTILTVAETQTITDFNTVILIATNSLYEFVTITSVVTVAAPTIVPDKRDNDNKARAMPTVLEARDGFGRHLGSYNDNDQESACLCLGYHPTTVYTTRTRTAKPTTKIVGPTVHVPGPTKIVTTTYTRTIEITQLQTVIVPATKTVQQFQFIKSTQTNAVTHKTTLHEYVTVTMPVAIHQTLTQPTTVTVQVENDRTAFVTETITNDITNTLIGGVVTIPVTSFITQIATLTVPSPSTVTTTTTID